MKLIVVFIIVTYIVTVVNTSYIVIYYILAHLSHVFFGKNLVSVVLSFLKESNGITVMIK